LTVDRLGELAALGTAVCWTVTVLAFESAGRRVGSLSVNLIRLLMAFVFLTLVGTVTRGVPLPTDAPPTAWQWLTLSGLVGFALGDLCLFRAFVVIGSRLSSLLMSLVPPFAATVGWLALGEQLGPRELLGMVMTVSGVAWVIRERTPDASGAHGRPPIGGILLGLGGALGQAVGLVLTKRGIGSYDAFAANQIRILAGIAGFVVIFTATNRWPRFVAALAHPAAMSRTLVGAGFGPFLGVTLSLIAVRNTETGVAATLMALVPVLILPAAVWLRKERLSARAVAGAVVAVAGAAVLFS